MSLTNVWLRTLGDGLVRADQVIGIDAHQTPALTGKPSYWLFDVVLPQQFGSGTRGEWGLNVLHRTLIQTSQPPGEEATGVLARLLAELDVSSAAGIIDTTRDADGEDGPFRFQFSPFTSRPGEDDAGGEYL